jgi:hypothetical protein
VITSATILEIFSKYFLLANAAIVCPMIIATAINAVPLGISPLIPKICIPKLAIPKERTAKIIAMTKPTMLIANSFDVANFFLSHLNPQGPYF